MKDRSKRLNEALQARARELLQARFPNGRINGHEFALGSIAGEAGSSFKFNLLTHLWSDFACPEISGKGLITLFSLVDRVSFREAAADLSVKLGLQAGPQGSAPKFKADWPVPRTAPPPPLTPGRMSPTGSGRLTASYAYRNGEGDLLGYVARFDTDGVRAGKGKKVILPLNHAEGIGWRWKGHGHDRSPMYGLDKLASRPEAPVLVVEGEKAADAASQLFPGYVCITWMGGTGGLRSADYSALVGRDVTLWPDADEPGLEAAAVLEELLGEVGVQSLRVVKLPFGLPKGWDVADTAPEGINLQRLLNSAAKTTFSAVPKFHLLSFDQLVVRVIYNSGTEQFVDRLTGLRRMKPQIDALFRDRKGEAMGMQLLKDSRLTRTIDFAFRPGEPVLSVGPDGLQMLNLWRPGDVEPRAGDPTPFMDHVRHLCSNDEEAETLLDWTAFQVQRLGRKLMWAVVIQGPQGTGKSMFGEILRRLLGRHNTTMVTTFDLLSNYNDWIEGRSLVIVEEVMALGRREIMNNIKPLITQPRIPISAKHIRRYEIENCANFLLLTNHPDALPLDADDRRFFIISSAQPRQKPAYYATLASWMEENAGVVLKALLDRDLARFDPNAPPPMTEGKRQMIDAARHPLEAIIIEALESKTVPFERDLATLSDLMQGLKGPNGLAAGVDVNSARLQTTLKKLGAVQLGQKVIKERGVPMKASLWALRDGARYSEMDSSTLMRLYLQRTSDGIPY